MTELIDKSYFRELNNATPELLCNSKGCRYDQTAHQYTLEIWGDQYLVDPARGKIDHPAANTAPHEYFDLFAIYYLLRTGRTILQGEWVSEKDLPGGPTFFRGPHLIPTSLITDRFANKLQDFADRCRQLGGTPLELADAAYRFSITDDIPVAVLYWIGDDLFPPEAKVLYDKSITDMLSLDIIYALAVGICGRISDSA